MNFSKKHTAIPLSLLLICVIARGFLVYYLSIAPFAVFCKELAIDSLQDNPFELHYSIAYPDKMDLGQLSKNLIPFQPALYTQNKDFWQKRLQTLTQMQKGRLSEQNEFLYSLLLRHVELQLDSTDFPYYENPISCSGGIHSQLPILLSEYTFRSKEDIENYFILLGQIPDYLDGIGTYLKTQELNGIYIYEEFLQKAAAQCMELFPPEQIDAGAHFLQTSFLSRIDSLVSTNIVSEKEKADYILRNNTLVKTKLLPAYTKLSEHISALKGTASLAGLSALPKGKDYYALLLRGNTGSDKTVQQLKDILYQRYDTLYQEYTQLLENGTYAEHFDFPYKKHSEMLNHLYNTSQTVFPALDSVTGDIAQQIQLKAVDGILKDMSAPAFYMTPPIDDNSKHTIYVNPAQNTDPLELYTTLAHEGFPGHLYQTVYSQTALNTAHQPLIRQLLYYGGYTEGWAVYAEFYSYDFIKAGCDEALADTIALARLNREIQLCLCTILDIYIHYEGASLENTKALLATLGLNPSGGEAIYEAICDVPGNYPKYYIGYLEILEMKEAAKEHWGKDYSDYAFHKWFLETGPADFNSLAFVLD